MIREKLYYVLFAAIFAANPVCASVIHILNENEKPIKIQIKPDGDTEAVMKIKVPQERVSKLHVNREHLNGGSLFSITGDTNPFTSGGKCKNLNVDQDYNVSFTNDKMGTSCVAEVITK